ncbi:MAG: cobyrinate a,c-diamide synthase [Desulfobacterales bacterium]|nr:cobyrinate a,c-diamide synthase [Desulfobacterales bacterium]
MKGIVIAAPKSGSGKTTVSLGLLAALKKRGLAVAPFKVGPDFIDPGHHQRITDTISRNLDGWMLSKEYNLECFNKHAGPGTDIAVVEGVMGVYDGYDGKTDAGSTAQMAKWLRLPVILVVDAKSLARSAAALVQGFERFDPDLNFAGVIFNNVGSETHLSYLREALEGNVRMPLLGGLPQNSKITIPERHLGLVTQDDHVLSEEAVTRLADHIDDHIDVDALLSNLPGIEVTTEDTVVKDRGNAIRIGVARDKAFCFYYKDNLELLELFGAEPVYFSPISDKLLPENIRGIYFGGGYPELFSKELAGNKTLRNQIKDKSNQGMPIYGECGGFMYLCEDICDPDKNTYPMTGCFPLKSAMTPKLRSLGYREVTLTTDSILGKQGLTVRGHEFHYSEIINIDDCNIKTVYSVSRGPGKVLKNEGFLSYKTLGSYYHLHFGSRPEAARSFVEACKKHNK